MEELLRTLVTIALAGLLVILRLDAERFGVAEYHEAEPDGRFVSLLRRAGWILTGLALVGVLLVVAPAPEDDLFLQVGDDRFQVILYGFAFAAGATVQAILFALIRYGRIRLPPLWSYPTAILNSLGTAFIDEATFRGAVLGLLILAGVNPWLAVLIQTLLYALATRMGAPGRDRYMLVVALVSGYILGWMTIQTGGIGAAFLGHTALRFAMFLCTGHAGRSAPRGEEVEEQERVARPPRGWRTVGPGGPSGKQ